jgi:hypothetical protein
VSSRPSRPAGRAVTRDAAALAGLVMRMVENPARELGVLVLFGCLDGTQIMGENRPGRSSSATGAIWRWCPKGATTAI